MKNWTLPQLIEDHAFGIMETLPCEVEELEPVTTIEYELTDDHDPLAWVRSEHHRQAFNYSRLKAVLRIFKASELTLTPKVPSKLPERDRAHLLVVKTSYKTYGVLVGVRKKEDRS